MPPLSARLIWQARRMDFLQSPLGPVLIPDELAAGRHATNFTARWVGDEVALYFWQSTHDDPDAAEGTVGEVVAHLFMERERFEKLPAVIKAMIEIRTDGAGSD